MRTPISLITFCLFLTFLATTLNAQSKNTDRILSLEKEWVTAVTGGDEKALERLFSEDLTYTHSNGNTDNKKEYIANLKSGKLKYLSISASSEKVRDYGSTAIYTCRCKISVLSAGQAVAFDGIVIHVWVRIGGSWRLAAHQSTRLP